MIAFEHIAGWLGDRVASRNGKQAEARCPAHDDRRASLSVGVRTQGDPGAVVRCQAGCETEDVMAALELPMAALFDRYWSAIANGRRIIATYPYTDERGELLYEVVRFEPKGFSQRRPDGNGDWIWNLNDTLRVPYRLPGVLKAVAGGKRVFIVEGEKDVHALEAAGEVATCNSGGAGKWRNGYGATLRGADVTVVADRDEPGRKHAERVRASLEGVAVSVQVVEPAEGKDAADHLNAGRDVDEFEPVASTERVEVSHLPVQDTGELLAAVETFVRRFVVLPSTAGYLTAALYVLHTWAFDAAHATPYLVVESPEKQSGKTRLLEVLELVCRNPVKVASITAAALFQTVGYGTPTLLIDEADAIFAGKTERSEDLRGVLNAGNAPGSVVIRGGHDGKPVSYPVFCPKVIAGIATGRLPETIRDRAVVVAMDRKLRSERVERLRRRRVQGDVDQLRERLQAWAVQNMAALEPFELADTLEQISDRMEEAWEPLLAIADLAGRDCAARARAAALHLAAADEDDGTTASHMLLLALRDMLGDREAMFSRQVVAALNADKDLPFESWNDGIGIKSAEVAGLLKRYRIHPRTVRVGSETAKGYQREWFETAWERYGGVLPVTPVTSQCSSGIPGFGEPSHDGQCDGAQNGENASPIRVVTGVTAKSSQTASDETKRSPSGRFPTTAAGRLRGPTDPTRTRSPSKPSAGGPADDPPQLSAPRHRPDRAGRRRHHGRRRRVS